MSVRSFSERWLRLSGLSDHDIPDAVESIRQRITRYPPLIQYSYRVSIFFFILLGPFFIIGRLRRAHALDDQSFERLLERAYTHRFLWVRALFILIQMPLIEVLTRERTPPPVSHPLIPFLTRKADPKKHFDVIVIGSGAGGAPVAWDLTRRGYRVALIEQGTLPIPQSGAGALEKFYLSQGMLLSMRGGLSVVIAGSTLGGTTSINSGTCLRPLNSCLTAWDETCGTSFSSGILNPWLIQVEEKLGVYQPPRELLSVSSRLFEQGLAALGKEGSYILPRNAPNCEGSGRCCFVCPTGAKLGSDRAFLPEALAAGMDLFSPSRAMHIEEKRDGVSLHVESQDGPHVLYGKHLVLAAGALFTPGLIRRNRLGHRWRQAGQYLKIHPAGKVLAHFPTIDDDKRGVPQGLAYHPQGFSRLTLEGIHVPKSVLGPTITKTGRQLGWWLRESHRIASFGMFVQDRQSGQVSEWNRMPMIRYRTHPDDILDLGRACLMIAEVFFRAGADRVLLPVVGRLAEFTSLQALSAIRPEDFTAHDFMVSGFHPQGTAAIGRLVDSDLSLIGSQRISVCDASILPDSPGVNPMETIMAFSLRLAQHLAEKQAISC